MKIEELLAKNLKELRDARGLTQAALAERADLSEQAVQLVESKRRWPRAETLDAFARALGVPVAALFAQPGAIPIV